MKLAIATVSWSLSGAVASAGVSAEAGSIQRRTVENMEHLLRSESVGCSTLLADLGALAEKCRSPDWDGYGAKAIQPDAVQAAARFLRALPLGAPRPTVSADNDGHVTLEWYRSPTWTFSISVDPDGRLHYAALFGSASHWGTEPFVDQIPPSIVQLVRQVHPAW